MANQVDASLIRQYVVEGPSNTGATRASLIREYVVEGPVSDGRVWLSTIRQWVVEGPMESAGAAERRRSAVVC